MFEENSKDKDIFLDPPMPPAHGLWPRSWQCSTLCPPPCPRDQLLKTCTQGEIGLGADREELIAYSISIAEDSVYQSLPTQPSSSPQTDKTSHNAEGQFWLVQIEGCEWIIH